MKKVSQNNYKRYVFVKYYVQIRNREKIEKDMEGYILAISIYYLRKWTWSRMCCIIFSFL